MAEEHNALECKKVCESQTRQNLMRTSRAVQPPPITMSVPVMKAASSGMGKPPGLRLPRDFPSGRWEFWKRIPHCAPDLASTGHLWFSPTGVSIRLTGLGGYIKVSAFRRAETPLPNSHVLEQTSAGRSRADRVRQSLGSLFATWREKTQGRSNKDAAFAALVCIQASGWS